MRKKFTAFVIACLIGVSVFAGGNTGIGVRISREVGITLNHHFKRGTALEGIVEFYDGGVVINGLYEKFHSLDRGNTFFFYYGGGVFITTGGGNGAGLRGVVGLDYRFKDLPFEIGADWMPSLLITPDVQGDLNLLGVSVRFTF